MGNFINKVTHRVFVFPIKLHPVCFLRQEEYSSTGELILTSPIMVKQELEYDKLLQNFTENLKAKKKKQRILIETQQMNTLKDVLEDFPEWNDMTISVLHHLYLLFADPKNSMLSFHDFCAILEYLGDRNTPEVRVKKFDKADRDKDGFILFSEFLSALYNFNHSKKGGLQGLAALCKEAAERSKAVSSLTLGEQLEYGLF